MASQGFWFVPLNTLLGFDPQVQFQLVVDLVDTLVVLTRALDVAKIKSTGQRPNCACLPSDIPASQQSLRSRRLERGGICDRTLGILLEVFDSLCQREVG